ncbi:putative SWEET sugar transporter [Helianthus debilis subsp. tardiflorus]
MPFFLSLFVFLCGTSWFIFGLLGNDPFVYVSNGFGSVLGALQLILYAIYRNNKGEKGGKPAETKDGGSSMEMGLRNGNEHLERGKTIAVLPTANGGL